MAASCKNQDKVSSELKILQTYIARNPLLKKRRVFPTLETKILVEQYFKDLHQRTVSGTKVLHPDEVYLYQEKSLCFEVFLRIHSTKETPHTCKSPDHHRSKGHSHYH